MQFETVSHAETVRLRHSVLRPNQGVEACTYPGDEKPETRHYALRDSPHSEAICVASVYCESAPQSLHFGSGLRLRGMATLPSLQRKGWGRVLIKKIINSAPQDFPHATHLWCNARLSALGFYENLGFRVHGEIFEVPEIGPHKIASISLGKTA